ncbi:MAG: hypothetical protein ACOCOC_06930 [Prevotella sp.]
MSLEAKDIEQHIEQIRDERREAANTAKRVGSTMMEIFKYVAASVESVFSDFLRKDQDDETTHKLTMGEAAVKGNLTLGANGTYSISKEGVAKLAGVVAEYLKSANFQAGTAMGFDGQGYGITKGTDGKYTLEIDNLIARMKMIVADLEVHEMSFIGGTVVMSSCGNRVDRVEALDADGNTIAAAYGTQPTLTIPSDKTAERFRCYFLASDGDRQIKNEWTVGQLARAKTNNIAAPGNYTDYQNRDYWRLVVGVSSAPVTKEGKQYHYIDLSNSTSKDIVLTGADGKTRHVTLGGVSETLNSLPFAGDNVIGMGHCFPEEEKRQNIAILSVLQGGWVIYKGINNYDLPHDNIVNKFGIDEAIITTDHLILRPYAAPNETQTVAVVRGPYSDKNDYGHNDLTTLDGQTWIGSGIPIGKTIKGEKPSATSAYWSLAAAKGIQGEQGDGYSISFLLNNVPVDVINFDTVKGMEGSEVTLEADFYNNAVSANVNKAVITCYDADGNVLGSPIEATNAENIVVDGGNLYLSKLCAYITTIAYDADGKMLVSKSIGVVRNGESVGVKSVTYKVINNVDAGAALNWDSVTAQTTYPTQKPDKGKYCYVMTIVAYSDGTTTNTVSTSYTPKDGNDGTSVKVSSTTVEYAGGDSGTTAPTSGWQSSVPSLAQGKYLWTRTTVTYSDGNSTTSYSVGRIGMDGDKGGTTHILYASSDHPSSRDDVSTTIDAGHQYYGTYQDTEVNDDVNKYTEVGSWVLIKGDNGDSYSVTFLLNGARVDVLNFDDVRTLTDATFEADFYNQGTAVNIPKATLTCYDADGNVLGSPIEIADASNIVADGGNLYLSKDCKTITAVGKDASDNVLFSSSVAVIRSTITYRLIPMSDCSATVKASGTSTDAKFTLSYNLHYKAAKLVGDRAEDATIATISATIENKDVTTTVSQTEGTLSGTADNGGNGYTSTSRPADSIPVTVTLSNGTVLYDAVKVTMEAGVAVDINQKLGTMSVKVLSMDRGLLDTGVDIEKKRFVATANHFVVRNNSAIGEGNAYFKGTVTGSTIKGGTINGSTINGGTINGSKFVSKSADGNSQTIIKGGLLKARNGEFEGILRLSCASKGDTASANLFYLEPIDNDQNLTFPCDANQPGKVIRFFNSGNFGKGTYNLHFNEFSTIKPKEGDTLVLTVSDEIFWSPVRPQECIEVTCFEDVGHRVVKEDGSIEIHCYWEITGRFSYLNFVRNNNSNLGSRYPRVICMGRMNYNNGSPYLSGKWWNSSYNIGSKITLTRVQEGRYKLAFASTDIPDGYTVMVTGFGAGTYQTGEGRQTQRHNYYKTACIHEQSQEYIIIDIAGSSDSGQKLYDGDFNFVIFAPDWDFPLGT